VLLILSIIDLTEWHGTTARFELLNLSFQSFNQTTSGSDLNFRLGQPPVRLARLERRDLSFLETRCVHRPLLHFVVRQISRLFGNNVFAQLVHSFENMATDIQL
jgi:hypothetical protein